MLACSELRQIWAESAQEAISRQCRFSDLIACIRQVANISEQDLLPFLDIGGCDKAERKARRVEVPLGIGQATVS